ncbi:MAG: hypothetical protein JWQ09_2562 [Segetibacter sp.]|nr:hypothetical protein [Segetibacter sp.]
MINTELLVDFLKENFEEEQLLIDRFKPDLIFIDVDCLKDETSKLTMALSSELIQIATVSKEPVLDFSLYDFNIDDIQTAMEYIRKVKDDGIYFKLENLRLN